jgi:mono/diheme cytochrome c family protein
MWRLVLVHYLSLVSAIGERAVYRRCMDTVAPQSGGCGVAVGRKMGPGRIIVGSLALLALAGLIVGVVLAQRFLQDEAVVYDDITAHFKYGSTGGERNLGFPYWVWKALPRVCANHLPDGGLADLGFFIEAGKDLPVGMSKRRHLGIDRVFLNCAVCHSSTVRTAADEPAQLVLGMPAATLNLMAFEQFMQDCVGDVRFSPDLLIPEIQALGANLSLLDRYVVYPLAIHIMRDRVIALLHRLRFFKHQPDWGPGRVDTFGSAKGLFNFPFETLPQQEMLGTADFPSIWMQAPREDMQLHWDGNNRRVQERNLNASFGTGATPPIIDHAAIERIQEWLWMLQPPPYPFAIDQQLADRGQPVYAQYCARCHGVDGRDFSGDTVGEVIPLEAIGTDRWRLDSFTPTLSRNLGAVYAGYPEYRFKNFRKTWGYASMPLDGLWLRAPYLHNGSVPTVWDLLQPAAQRPETFYRGNDRYHPTRLGFVWDQEREGDRNYFLFDTKLSGNGNQGHEGRDYGTELSDDDKWAVVEYLKTF